MLDSVSQAVSALALWRLRTDFFATTQPGAAGFEARGADRGLKGGLGQGDEGKRRPDPMPTHWAWATGAPSKRCNGPAPAVVTLQVMVAMVAMVASPTPCRAGGPREGLPARQATQR